MPTSPFGLGYGLGVMGTQAPLAFNQMQNMALQRQVQQLQLQQMQRQEAEQQATQQAAMAVKPEMEQYTPLQKVGEELPTTPASPEVAGKLKALGLPSAIPEQPTDAQMQAVQQPLRTALRQKIYTTPYQQAAYRYGAMADYLFKQGMVEPAMRLQAQAMQANQLHQNTTLSLAARAASTGAYSDASRLLNGIGFNISGMDQSPDDPSAVRIQSTQNGTPVYADIPRQFVGAMIEDPAKASQMMSMLDWRMGAIQSRERQTQARIESTEKQKELDRQSREKIASDRIQAQTQAYGAGGKTPAKVAVWNFAEQLVRKEHPDWTDSQVMDATAKHPLVSAASSSMEKTDRNNAAKLLGVIRKELGGEPQPNDPGYEEYQKLKTMAFPSLGKAPAPKQAAPKANYEGEVSPSGAYVFRGGQWVPNKG